MDTEWVRRVRRIIERGDPSGSGHACARKRGRVTAVYGVSGTHVYEVTDKPSVRHGRYVSDVDLVRFAASRSCSSLLALLEAPGQPPADRAAAASIRGMLGEEATRRADVAFEDWEGPELEALSGEAGAARLREILDAAPTQRLRGDVHDRADPMGWARRLAGALDPSPARVRRLLATPEVGSVLAFEMLLALPEDWTPREPAEWNAANRIALSLSADPIERSPHTAWRCELAATLGTYGFLKGCRGRWVAYAERLGCGSMGAAEALRLRVCDVSDMLRAFAHGVAVPALHRHGLCDDLYPVTTASPACAVAGKLLFGDKGLPAILDASSSWHAGGTPAAAGTGKSWPVPFAGAASPEGFLFRPLSSDRELADEGGALMHCVGGYGPRCAAGESVIVSVRSPDGAPSSTLELARPAGPGKPFTPVQHRGLRNVAATPADRRAVAWLVSVLGTAALPVDPAFLAHRWKLRHHSGRAYDPMDDAALAEAVAAWAPYLPRPLRTPAAVERACVAAVRDVARDRFAPFPEMAVGGDGGLVGFPLEWRWSRPMIRYSSTDTVEAAWRRRLRHRLPLRARERAALALNHATTFSTPCAGIVPCLWLGTQHLNWFLSFGIVLGGALAAALSAVAVLMSRPAARLRHRFWLRRAAAAARALDGEVRATSPALGGLDRPVTGGARHAP